mmetsp:Transcript_4425/g.12040  ORF Transcript_4425/g.12040 Transcript_4425/m.12040 type:complete len:128 (-) Transcript_4425:197-580(-)
MPFWWTFGKVPEVSAPELQQLSQSLDIEETDPKPLIIDVRTEAEYAAGHVKHAVNASFLPPWSFRSRVEPIVKDVPKSAQIIVICLSAHRSIGAYKWLRNKGFSNVKQLAAGMQDWRARHLPEQTQK